MYPEKVFELSREDNSKQNAKAGQRTRVSMSLRYRDIKYCTVPSSSSSQQLTVYCCDYTAIQFIVSVALLLSKYTLEVRLRLYEMIASKEKLLVVHLITRFLITFYLYFLSKMFKLHFLICNSWPINLRVLWETKLNTVIINPT